MFLILLGFFTVLVTLINSQVMFSYGKTKIVLTEEVIVSLLMFEDYFNLLNWLMLCREDNALLEVLQQVMKLFL